MPRVTSHLNRCFGSLAKAPNRPLHSDLKSRIQQFFSDIAHAKTEHGHLYRELVDIEKVAAGEPHRIASCELRHRMTPKTVDVFIRILLSDEDFSVKKDILPKLRRAADAWHVDKRRILFCVSFDHCTQGRPSFVALAHLAEAHLDWDSCIGRLNQAATERRAGYCIYNPYTKSLSGIALEDVNVAAQSFNDADKPTPDSAGPISNEEGNVRQKDNIGKEDTSGQKDSIEQPRSLAQNIQDLEPDCTLHPYVSIQH
ncbi:hypothetical protein ColTof4_14036 [Colletotrichum tofieldiae]|nr:hypothetical protein ColTof3_14671 [Colletotrichum tofieldiae]GKT81613.1 hypothetical protein ColTof4_14036 [Colletotrichum tofieldiae]GKT97587.1 hypothetical protein Ct61P_15437 [Colletotrichum tofieldiae]